MYFNNERDLLQAIYRSTMEEDMGKGLQMKGQDEIIGKDRKFKKPQYRDTKKDSARSFSEDETI